MFFVQVKFVFTPPVTAYLQRAANLEERRSFLRFTIASQACSELEREQGLGG
ncbi:MAG: hypothetical protein ACI8R9_001676 [Paraglaciecola sp.]|jgi:hypothetical protein